MADDKDLQAKAAAFAHPLFVPEEFKGWLSDQALRWSTDHYASQIQGLRSARFVTGNTVTDNENGNPINSFHDLATVGPKIDKLADGTYMFMWGFEAFDSGTHAAVIFINDDFADGRGTPGNHDANELVTFGSGAVMNIAVWTINDHTPGPFSSIPLGNGTGFFTARCVYETGTLDRFFARRWMHAIRLA